MTVKDAHENGALRSGSAPFRLSVVVYELLADELKSAVRAKFRTGRDRGATVRTEVHLTLRTGRSRSAPRLLPASLALANRVSHCLTHCHTGAEPDASRRGSATAWVLGGVTHCLRRLKLGEGTHIPDCAHTRALIDHLGHFIRRRDGFDLERHQLETDAVEVVAQGRSRDRSSDRSSCRVDR